MAGGRDNHNARTGRGICWVGGDIRGPVQPRDQDTPAHARARSRAQSPERRRNVADQEMGTPLATRADRRGRGLRPAGGAAVGDSLTSARTLSLLLLAVVATLFLLGTLLLAVGETSPACYLPEGSVGQ